MQYKVVKNVKNSVKAHGSKVKCYFYPAKKATRYAGGNSTGE